MAVPIPVPIPIDLTMSAAPWGWKGMLPDFFNLFLESLSGYLSPTFLTGQNGGPMPTSDIGPWFDGSGWWFFDPLSGQYQPSNQGLPVGTIALWGGSNAPPHWLWCDGSAVSRFTYSRLFNAIGETFGEGDGQSTFNLPPGAKFYLNAAGWATNAQVPVDTISPPAGSTETATAYPSEGAGARGGSTQGPLLLASNLPPMQVVIPVSGRTFASVGDTGKAGSELINIQPASAVGATNEMTASILDMNGNSLGVNQQQWPSMPPYCAILHMIKYT